MIKQKMRRCVQRALSLGFNVQAENVTRAIISGTLRT